MQRAAIDGLIFIGGIAIGIVIGARTSKRKYEAAKDEEITQMRNMHMQMLKERSTEEAIIDAYNDLMAEKAAKEKKEKEKATEQNHKDEVIKKEVNKLFNPFGLPKISLEDAKKEAKAILAQESYSSDKDGHPLDEDDEDEDEEPEPILERISRNERKNMKESYVISPAEFGEEDYEEIELTYYADDILADDHGDIIEDPEDVIGPRALLSFGEYEDDAVYVRNDERRCDYAVLKDLRKYSDLPKGRR